MGLTLLTNLLLKIQIAEDIMSRDRLSDLEIRRIIRYRFSEIEKGKVLEMFAHRKVQKVNIL